MLSHHGSGKAPDQLSLISFSSKNLQVKFCIVLNRRSNSVFYSASGQAKNSAIAKIPQHSLVWWSLFVDLMRVSIFSEIFEQKVPGK
jgi:hypothetical protein